MQPVNPVCLEPVARPAQISDVISVGCSKALGDRLRRQGWGGGGKEEKEICSVLILVPVSFAGRLRLQPAPSPTCSK